MLKDREKKTQLLARKVFHNCPRRLLTVSRHPALKLLCVRSPSMGPESPIPESPSRRVPSLQVPESPSPRVSESPSLRVPESPSPRVSESPSSRVSNSHFPVHPCPSHFKSQPCHSQHDLETKTANYRTYGTFSSSVVIVRERLVLEYVTQYHVTKQSNVPAILLLLVF